jgi:Uma2 family endonuclease
MAASTAVTAERPVFYPESDGKPMAETEVHIDALIYLRETLKDYFRDDPQVYVAGNMLLYYEEGNPAACVAPDVFVVKGVEKHERRTYKLWEESQPPTVIFEITSRSTRLEDLGTKRALYALLGVQEYFLYDPLGEYLRPPLQGYRLEGSEYQRMESLGPETLMSEALGVALRLEANQLHLIDPTTGERLLSPAEAYKARRQEAAARQAAEAQAAQEAAARQAAEARLSQEVAARQAVEARMAHFEAELERLRDELGRLKAGSSNKT